VKAAAPVPSVVKAREEEVQLGSLEYICRERERERERVP